MKAKLTKAESEAGVAKSELVILRRRWKTRIKDLNTGQNWAVNDRACKEARSNKAEGVQECIIGINYLLKHGNGSQELREIRRLRKAIKWALGEGGDFPTRPEGKGPYYWRTELRRRAGM